MTWRTRTRLLGLGAIYDAGVDGLRRKLFPAVWGLMWPVRAYIRHWPVNRGKGLLERLLIEPLLPPRPISFDQRVWGGGVVRLLYRERIGLSTLLHGSFEEAEVGFVCDWVERGSVVIDVGANVGIFTVPLATAVGEEGSVWAIEPSPENVRRLRRNLEINQLHNVRILEVALAARAGSSWLRLREDPAYATISSVAPGKSAEPMIPVDVLRLDDLWRDAGRPTIAAIKIDVEGAELDVVRGAEELLEVTAPLVLIEVAERADTAEVMARLTRFGYRHVSRPDFEPWNHLFIRPREAHTGARSAA